MTWTKVTNPQPGSIPIDAHRWGDGVLWSAPGGGLYRTTAEGAQPQRIAVQGSTAYDVAVAERPGAGAMLLAGTDRDVYDTPLPTGPITPDTAEWGLSGKEATFGAVVGQIEVSAHHPEVVWRVRKAATGQFYVYRSNDGGATWTQRGLTGEVPFALYVHPDDPNQVVVAFGSLRGSGLYVTRDGGTTWRKVIRPGVVHDLAGDPEHPGRLWIASSEGTFSSDDLGETWTLRLNGPAAAVAVSGDRVVVGDRSIRVSDDGGRRSAPPTSADCRCRWRISPSRRGARQRSTPRPAATPPTGSSRAAAGCSGARTAGGAGATSPRASRPSRSRACWSPPTASGCSPGPPREVCTGSTCADGEQAGSRRSRQAGRDLDRGMVVV